MGLNVKVGAFTTDTGVATTTQAITGLGFTPKLILFWWGGETSVTANAGRLTRRQGFGAATSTTNRGCSATMVQDAQATSNTNAAMRDDALIATITTAGAIDGLMDLASMDADGFTLVVDDQFATAVRVHYMALGGTDIEAKVGSFPGRTSVGAEAVTGVGFEPVALLLWESIYVGTFPALNSDAPFMLGAATSSSNEHVTSIQNGDNKADMVARHYSQAGEIFAHITGTGDVGWRAALTSLDADGFTLNWTEITAAVALGGLYVAIGGTVQVACGNLVTATDTTPFTETGVGFQPAAALFVSTGSAQNALDTMASDDHMSIGAATSATERGVHAWQDDDAAASSTSSVAVAHDAIYLNLTDAGAVQGAMDLTSFDSDGMTLVMDDADPSAAFVWYLAIAAAPVAPGGFVPRLSLLGVG